VRIGRDIQNISGATLSCEHVTDGIRRLLATYAIAIAAADFSRAARAAPRGWLPQLPVWVLRRATDTGHTRRNQRQRPAPRFATARRHRCGIFSIERVHALMSFQEPDSELSRLNRHAAERPSKSTRIPTRYSKPRCAWRHERRRIRSLHRATARGMGAAAPCAGAC
jgi:hypothetical protein